MTRIALPLLLLASGCGEPLHAGNDLLWSADQELGNLEQWTHDSSGEALTPRPPAGKDTPSERASVDVSAEMARRGSYSVKLVNPGGWEEDFEGPELYHAAGSLSDAYYSAWFMLPEPYEVSPYLTLMRLRSRNEAGELFNGEELQLRNLSRGGYVLSVFSNNAGFLLEPVADPAPHVQAGRWFQLEVRYEAQDSGRLRVWLDGTLYYDLRGRPGSAATEQVLSVCNAAQRVTPAPGVLFVDDAAVSLSRVTPTGKLAVE